MCWDVYRNAQINSNHAALSFTMYFELLLALLSSYYPTRRRILFVSRINIETNGISRPCEDYVILLSNLSRIDPLPFTQNDYEYDISTFFRTYSEMKQIFDYCNA